MPSPGNFAVCLGHAYYWPPFTQFAEIPGSAGTFDVTIICDKLYMPGTLLSVNLSPWSGPGEAWVHYVRLRRAGDLKGLGSTSTGVQGSDRSELPGRQPVVGRAYPSPTAGSVSMIYDLMHPAKSEVNIYDRSGALISRLSSDGVAGTNLVAWDGTDEQRRNVAAGVYYYDVRSEGRTVASGKVTVTR
jgi:hypothetical protein